MKKQFILFLSSAFTFIACTEKEQPKIEEWSYTTPNSLWEIQAYTETEENASDTIFIQTSNVDQTIDGFGVCFSELGWSSLNKLSASDRNAILDEFFIPNKGGNLTINRTPIAASDFALDYYSYNDTEGDFEMKNFSIAHDTSTLVPFIKEALSRNSKMKIWASPWTPPFWMKHVKHYASRSTKALERIMKERHAGESTYMFKMVDNGMDENNQGAEGTDMFILEDAYLKAYALYFQKYIQAYKEMGISIFGIMPQNEPNSAQIYPSCCWTSHGLSEFIGKYLGPAMDEIGTDVYLGTMERPKVALVDSILTDPECAKYIKGVGFQWAGREAIPEIHKKYPNLKLFMSEQECGNGKNDWKAALHAWELMKHYLNNGVSIYNYWNISLFEGGISHWGWSQNSLVVVNETDKTYRYTYEYSFLKHASHYVENGAKFIKLSETDNAIAFINPDNSVILLAANETDQAQTIQINIDGKCCKVSLAPQSLNTFKMK